MFFLLSVWDDEVLLTPEITTFLAKPVPKLHAPAPSNAISKSLYANLLLIAFVTNLTVPSKQFFNVKLLLRLLDQLFIS